MGISRDRANDGLEFAYRISIETSLIQFTIGCCCRRISLSPNVPYAATPAFILHNGTYEEQPNRTARIQIDLSTMFPNSSARIIILNASYNSIGLLLKYKESVYIDLYTRHQTMQLTSSFCCSFSIGEIFTGRRPVQDIGEDWYLFNN